MLICESNLANALSRFFEGAVIPRAAWLSSEMEAVFIKTAVLPAFLDALWEIEDVQLCYGFDLDEAFELFMERNKQ